MTKKYEKNIGKLAKRSGSRKRQLDEVEASAIARFRGQMTTLESALGMLRLGDHVGWKVLAIVHSRRTIRRYEEILGIRVREFFPEEGPSADRNTGYMTAKNLKDFWKAVTGEEKIEDKQEFRD